MKSVALALILCIASVALSSCRARQAGSEIAVNAPHQPGTSTFAWPQGKRAAVSLSFDDARASQVDIGIPILNAHGVKATFYVMTAKVEERLVDWKAVLAAGHEIGNHSMRHPCTGNFTWSREKALEDYTPERMAAELDQANAEIKRLLGIHPETYAYPCGQKYVGRGADTRSYVPMVARRFLAGRGWRDEGANDPAFCDPAQLMTVELDGLTFEQLKTLVDDAAKKGFWLVLCGHDVGPGGRQTTRVDTLEAFCKYAQDPAHGLWVDTVTNIARHVIEQRRAVNGSRCIEDRTNGRTGRGPFAATP